MYRSLLVPLDGSGFGEHALPLALSIARRASASLQVVHVHIPFVYYEGMTPLDGAMDVQTETQERAYLDNVVQRLATVAPVPVKAVVLNGPTAESLQEHAQATGVDLIVMTTHGRGALSRFWLGSVADELVRRAPMPLLLVRPQEAPPDLAQERTLRRMLVPLDGSELAEQILGPARALGTLMGSAYTMLRVIKPITPIVCGPTGPASNASIEALLKQLQAAHAHVQAEAETYLGRVAQRFRVPSVPIETRVVTGEQPAAAILGEAAARASDVIALETHGRRGLARLLLGSVADKVLRGAAVPVLIHRPAAKQ